MKNKIQKEVSEMYNISDLRDMDLQPGDIIKTVQGHVRITRIEEGKIFYRIMYKRNGSHGSVSLTNRRKSPNMKHSVSS